MAEAALPPCCLSCRRGACRCVRRGPLMHSPSQCSPAGGMFQMCQRGACERRHILPKSCPDQNLCLDDVMVQTDSAHAAAVCRWSRLGTGSDWTVQRWRPGRLRANHGRSLWMWLACCGMQVQGPSVCMLRAPCNEPRATNGQNWPRALREGAHMKVPLASPLVLQDPQRLAQ